jgi:glycosyltransferase involved in cell wall biosynthesis
MPSVLTAADVLVVPLGYSIHGAVPSKLYEAMASGRPVVLVADDEPKRIVLEANCGLCVAPGDVDALATAISRLAGSAELRRELGTHGATMVRARFDRVRITGGYLDCLESLTRE